jgi:hypothetical protein
MNFVLKLKHLYRESSRWVVPFTGNGSVMLDWLENALGKVRQRTAESRWTHELETLASC